MEPVQHRFLSVDDVLAIHEDTIRHEGGAVGVRDQGLLASAVMMPQQRFGGELLHDGLGAQAAAYLFHIAQNHPFFDGNKRAAMASAIVFLMANGIADLPPEQDMEAITMAVASSEMSKPDLIAWFREKLGEAA